VPYIRALAIDFGGVLTTPVRDSLATWIAADQVVPESFSAVLKAWLGRGAAAGSPVHRLETGQLTGPEFERELAARLRTLDGRPVDPAGLLGRMFAGMAVDAGMVRLLRRARAAGVRTALLSNSWANEYPWQLIDELCDVVVISSAVGLRKPDVAIFELVLERLGVPPAAAIFVDDAVPNVRGARSAGMSAIVHRDAATTHRELVASGLVLSDPAILEGP